MLNGTHDHTGGADEVAIDAGLRFLLELFPQVAIEELVWIMVGCVGWQTAFPILARLAMTG